MKLREGGECGDESSVEVTNVNEKATFLCESNR